MLLVLMKDIQYIKLVVIMFVKVNNILLGKEDYIKLISNKIKLNKMKYLIVNKYQNNLLK